MNAKKKAKKIFKEKNGLLRTSEALSIGIHPRTLYSMREEGELEQLATGVYRLREYPDFAEPDLVLIGKKIPRAVICLISALSYHQNTTQIPHFVYVAIPSKARTSRLKYPPIRYFRHSPKTYEAGVEIKMIGGQPVKMYSLEKTLADCLKFRNKIGMDVVLEALKMYSRRRGIKMDLLREYAKLNRVEKILQPIMETILSE
jgi:predicted transcriptional regulator of viral defense system